MLVFREAQKIFAKPCWYVFLACIYLPTENKIIGCCVAHHLCLSDGMKTNKTKAGKEKNTPVDVFRSQPQPVETCHFLLVNRRNRLCP